MPRQTLTPPRPATKFLYDGARMALDMADRGWTVDQLASKSRIPRRRVYYFFRGQFQTNVTARALARALGHDPAHYRLLNGR